MSTQIAESPDPLHEALLDLERATCAASEASRALRDAPGLARGVALFEPLTALMKATAHVGGLLARAVLDAPAPPPPPASSAPELRVVQ